MWRCSITGVLIVCAEMAAVAFMVVGLATSNWIESGGAHFGLFEICDASGACTAIDAECKFTSGGQTVEIPVH